MNEPLVSEDTNLDRLLETIRAEHGEAASILYHDSVRRGGVMGFFAQELHRVVYRVDDGSEAAVKTMPAETMPAEDLSHRPAVVAEHRDVLDSASIDMHPFEALLAQDLLTQADDQDGGNDEVSDLRITAYEFPRAEPLTRAFNHTAPTLDELIKAVEVDEAAAGTAATAPVARQTAQERFAELLKEMEALSAADAPAPAAVGAETALSSETIPTKARVARPVEPIKTDSYPTIEETPAEVEDETSSAAAEPAQASNDEPIVNGRHAAKLTTKLSTAPELIGSAQAIEKAQVVSLPATGNPDARSRLDMLMRLREVGVPAAVNPSGEVANIYQALDEILCDLATAPVPPRQPGEVLVIVGEVGPALRAAQAAARALRLRDSDIWVADLESHPALGFGGIDVSNPRTIVNPRQAARIRADLVQSDVASVIVLATDGAEGTPEDPWIGEMLEALRPTAVWACVDATRKPSDTLAALALLGDIDALAVHSAGISASPASVWEIGIPVALLDGRPATTPVWAGLLLSLLHSNATAPVTVTDEAESKPSARHRSA